MMDFASRFPEAIRIDAETVADTLCTVFTKFGIPEEILSDQGFQFTDEVRHGTPGSRPDSRITLPPSNRWHVGTLPRNVDSLTVTQYTPPLGSLPSSYCLDRTCEGPSPTPGNTTEEIRSPRMFLEGLKERLHFAWEKAKENNATEKSVPRGTTINQIISTRESGADLRAIN